MVAWDTVDARVDARRIAPGRISPLRTIAAAVSGSRIGYGARSVADDRDGDAVICFVRAVSFGPPGSAQVWVRRGAAGVGSAGSLTSQVIRTACLSWMTRSRTWWRATSRAIPCPSGPRTVVQAGRWFSAAASRPPAPSAPLPTWAWGRRPLSRLTTTAMGSPPGSHLALSTAPTPHTGAGPPHPAGSGPRPCSCHAAGCAHAGSQESDAVVTAISGPALPARCRSFQLRRCGVRCPGQGFSASAFLSSARSSSRSCAAITCTNEPLRVTATQA